MSADAVVAVCAAIATVGIVTDAAELTAARSELRRRFDWTVLRTAWGLMLRRPGLAMAVEGTLSPLGAVALNASRVIAAATAAIGCVVMPDERLVIGLAALAVVAGQIVMSTRLVYGLDGADQMQSMVWLGIALAQVSQTPGLTLIAAQSLLSYWIAGLAKLAGEPWRSGRAPGQIVATVSHGGRQAAMALARPGVSMTAAWATILFEVGGPLIALTSVTGAAIFVSAATVFHVGIATAMGLNTFVPAFCAALPAVLWLPTFLWTG